MVVELCCLLVDVVEEIYGDVLVDIVGVDIGSVEMGVRDVFIEFLWGEVVY